jgi:hypothetical protein
VDGDVRMQSPARAQAVAEAPVEAMLARADELAKRWAIALILARPLEYIGEIPLEELAREAPALFAQALRALQSDVELERLAGGKAPDRLEPTPAHRLAWLAGAHGASATVEAAEAMRRVLWGALREELGRPSFASASARRSADLADRLAHVCAIALAAALAEGSAVKAAEGEFQPRGGEARHTVRREGGYESNRPRLASRPVVLVDEWLDVHVPDGTPVGRERDRPSRLARTAAVPTADGWESPSSARALRTKPRPRPWDTPLQGNPTASSPRNTAPRGTAPPASSPRNTAPRGTAPPGTAPPGAAPPGAAPPAAASQGAPIDVFDGEGAPVMRVRRRTAPPGTPA